MRRETGCPLCGAKMTASQLLDACENLLSTELGVLSGRCPHCQGYLEVRPDEDKLAIGYLKAGSSTLFEQVTTLPSPGIEFEINPETASLTIRLDGRQWHFVE